MNLLSRLVAPLIGTGIGNIPLVKPVWYLAWRIFGTKKSELIDVQDFKMYTDPKDMIIGPRLTGSGCWEPYETQIFKELVKPGMTVIDVGANIGYYSLMASKLVGEKGKVYAFEPFESTCDILAHSIKANDFRNIEIVRKAVTNEVGLKRFYYDKYSPACNNINGKGSYTMMPCTTLDCELGATKVDVIKMDIEGAEALAFAGMKSIVNHNPYLILVTEVYPKALKRSGSSFEEYVGILLERFDVKVIEEKKQRLTPCETLEQVKRLMAGKMLLNMVCTRKPQ